MARGGAPRCNGPMDLPPAVDVRVAPSRIGGAWIVAVAMRHGGASCLRCRSKCCSRRCRRRADRHVGRGSPAQRRARPTCDPVVASRRRWLAGRHLRGRPEPARPGAAVELRRPAPDHAGLASAGRAARAVRMAAAGQPGSPTTSGACACAALRPQRAHAGRAAEPRLSVDERGAFRLALAGDQVQVERNSASAGADSRDPRPDACGPRSGERIGPGTTAFTRRFARFSHSSASSRASVATPAFVTA